MPRLYDIGHHLGEDRWEQLGKVSATTPDDAMSQWVEAAGAEPGEYGAQRAGDLEWIRFVVDDELIPHRVSSF